MAASGRSISHYEDRVPIDVFIVSPNARLRQDLNDKLGMPQWK